MLRKSISGRILAILAFFSLAQPAMAGGRCEGCTETQARERARLMGIGYHAIASYSTGWLWYYRVFNRNASEPSTPVVIAATPETPPAAVSEAYNFARRLYSESGGTMKAELIIETSEISSAAFNATVYDVLRDSAVRLHISNYLANDSRVLTNLGSSGTSLASLLNDVDRYFGDEPVIEVTVVFNGGARMRFVVTRFGALYKQGSARTAEDQPIPETLAAAVGTWTEWFFQPPIARHLQGLGADVSWAALPPACLRTSTSCWRIPGTNDNKCVVTCFNQ